MIGSRSSIGGGGRILSPNSWNLVSQIIIIPSMSRSKILFAQPRLASDSIALLSLPYIFIFMI